MKIAAISMRDDVVAAYGEVRSGLSTEWRDWLSTIGFQGVGILNGTKDIKGLLNRLSPALVVLTGGNDTVPGEDKGRVSVARDETEDQLIEWAIGANRPIFGVCRGLHKLNLHFGGRVEPALTGDPKAHVATTHPVRLSGPIARVMGTERVIVNSFHDQAVRKEGVGPDLEICGVSEPDGLVEALAHRNLPIRAVQWHPERPNGEAARCGAIVEDLLAWGGKP